MRNNDWTRILGWPGYRVYRSEIDEQAKALKLGAAEVWRVGLLRVWPERARDRRSL